VWGPSGHRPARTALVGAIACSPACRVARGGLAPLSSSALWPLGVAVLSIGLMLEAGASGAVTAIKVSAKLLADRSPHTPGDQASPGLNAAGPRTAPDSQLG